MSAKGRREGPPVPFDYFPTPAWCVDRLLDDCAADLFEGAANILEPTVGDGAIVRAVEGWHRERGRRVGTWTGIELRHVEHEPLVTHHIGGVDFRAIRCGYFDCAIGNPPYCDAESIIRHALQMSDRAAFLLRVGFLGSAERVPFWRKHGHLPFGLRVLPDRPSFDGEGTDSATYAWFVWGCPGVTGVKVLETTPIEVRSAQKPRDMSSVDPRQCGLFEAAS